MKITSRFITFEGGEGSGKSTQSQNLKKYLDSIGIKAIQTREIGGTPKAEKIRDLIVHQDFNVLTDLMLVMAARIEHVENLIIPALNQGKWVICDRYLDSTACYQGITSSVTEKIIYDLHNLVVHPLFAAIGRSSLPDHTFLLDVPAELGLLRNKERTDNNKFEEKPLNFHEKINKQFRKIAVNNTDRITIIDTASHNIQGIQEIICKKVTSLYICQK